jgi:ribosomal protein S19
MTRSGRSIWKIPYVHPLFLTKKFFKSKWFITRVRNITVTRKFRRKMICIHNGRVFIKRRMRLAMRGYKLGAFIMTKIFGRWIAKSMAIKAKRKKQDKKKKKIRR